MDILCPKCAEPWEIDSLHDYAEETGVTFSVVSRTFRTKGCGEAFAEWTTRCERRAGHEARGVLADLLGDDIDGYAALCEDFGL